MEGRRGRASSAQHSGGLLVIRGAQWPVGQLLGETDAWPCPEDPDRRYGRVLGRRPGARRARRTGWRWTVCGHTACLRPGFVCAAPKNLDRRSCSSLEALMVLARGARGAARTWSRRLWQCSTIRRKPSSRRAPRDDLPHARPPYESPAHISALEASSILRKN